MKVLRRWSSHAQFRKGLRLWHILEFGHGADPIRRPYFHQSLFGAMSQCPFTMDLPSWAVGHLPRDAMATAPHSHPRLRDQTIECGNLRGGLCNAQRGSVHVHAEHDRESRSEARACQSMKVYFHSTSPLFLPGPIPQIIRDGRSLWLNLAHLATPDGACHVHDCRSPGRNPLRLPHANE